MKSSEKRKPLPPPFGYWEFWAFVTVFALYFLVSWASELQGVNT